MTTPEEQAAHDRLPERYQPEPYDCESRTKEEAYVSTRTV
jgi:hypothetical protein